MDIRVEKTRRSIREAFMQLRVRKEPEEMTVKELCAAAQIKWPGNSSSGWNRKAGL